MASRKLKAAQSPMPTITSQSAEIAAREAARLYDAALLAGDEPNGMDLARISESILAQDWLAPDEEVV